MKSPTGFMPLFSCEELTQVNTRLMHYLSLCSAPRFSVRGREEEVARLVWAGYTTRKDESRRLVRPCPHRHHVGQCVMPLMPESCPCWKDENRPVNNLYSSLLLTNIKNSFFTRFIIFNKINCNLCDHTAPTNGNLMMHKKNRHMKI